MFIVSNFIVCYIAFDKNLIGTVIFDENVFQYNQNNWHNIVHIP